MSLEQIVDSLGHRMTKMPAAPLARTAQVAVRAGMRSVVAAQHRVGELEEKLGLWNHVALASCRVQAAIKSKEKQSQEIQADLVELRWMRKDADEELQALHINLRARDAELNDVRGDIADVLSELEDARARELAAKTRQRALLEMQAALQASLEEARATIVQATAEKLACERAAEMAAEAWEAELRRLSKEMWRAQAACDAHTGQALPPARDARWFGEVEATRRRLQEERQAVEASRAEHAELLEAERRSYCEGLAQLHVGLSRGDGRLAMAACVAEKLRADVARLRQDAEEAERLRLACAGERQRLYAELARERLSNGRALRAEADEYEKRLAHAARLQPPRASCSLM